MLVRHDQRQLQSQRIDPRLILANSILQLSSAELVQAIENELLDNPALETIEDTGCSGDCVDPVNCPYCSQRALARREGQVLDNAPDPADSEMDYEAFFSERLAASDESFDPVANLQAETGLRDHLMLQMRSVAAGDDQRLGMYLIDCLDERGWMDGDPLSIAADLGVEEESVCRMIGVLQQLDPPGIGAANLRDCLLLQLRYLQVEETSATTKRHAMLAERIVQDHFDHVYASHYKKLARALRLSVDEAKLVIQFIRTRLNPFPASQFHLPWATSSGNARSDIRPDVVIRRTDIGYEVEVVGAEAAQLTINPTYREAYSSIKLGRNEHRADERKHILEYVDRAQMFLRHLDQRRATLRRITSCIVECQPGFLETNSRQFLRALTRTRLAQMLELHESTVSRATANKFVQLPSQEVVSFNLFFATSLSVQDAIGSMIQSEDPAHPLSDQQIADLLIAKGIRIARRTVVKYREAQKILCSARRRRRG